MCTEPPPAWTYKPGTFAGSAHQVNDISEACYLLGKVGIWTHHWIWHAANGSLPDSATNVPTPSGDGGGWQSTGAFLCVYRHGNHGTTAGCWRSSAIPHSIQIPHLRRQGPSTYESTLWDHPQQITVLTTRSLPRIPRGLPWHQSSSGTMSPEDAVDTSTSLTYATNNSTLLHALTGKCKQSMPHAYGVGWGIIRTISQNWEKIFQCWFELATVQRQIWGIHHLSWGFGLWRSHLALNTLRPRQNGRHFADDIFKSIFLNENAGILLKIPLKFVPKVRISNIPALVQIMAWRRPGDKPLS